MVATGDIRCIVLDFDGTFTDVEREAVPFLEGYREGLAALVGSSLDGRWERALEIVESNPDAHGFEFEGRIVAPSHADPYILATSVANLVLGELDLVDVPDRAVALERLFRDSYGRSDTVFRSEAKQVAEAVLSHGAPVYVVSNSHTDHVEKKLARLAPEGLERLEVRGDARKFHLVPPTSPDPLFDAVPESMSVEGLGRPIYLRRGLYFDVLQSIWERTGTTPASTLVCGDIFELDLALPAALGAQIHLVTREGTPSYERDAAASVGGTSSTSLSGLLERL